MSSRGLLLAFPMVLAALVAACEGCKASGTGKPAARAEAPATTGRLVLLSDLGAALEPCGCVADQRGGVRVSLLQVVQGLVAQHHAPAKSVVGAVALDHGDLVRRVLLLHEQSEIQTSGPTANAQDVHVSIVEA